MRVGRDNIQLTMAELREKILEYCRLKQALQEKRVVFAAYLVGHFKTAANYVSEREAVFDILVELFSHEQETYFISKGGG